jgi:DNA-3-methyladenine glycosylase
VIARGFATGRRAAATDRSRTLTRSELPLDTVLLARYLLGKLLLRKTHQGVMSGRIVEIEAYPIGDAAGHAYGGMTPRNRSLFLSRGHAYIYLAYGTSYMLNVSSEAVGVGAGILIRALEPLNGIALMQRNRGIHNLRDLTRGPGRLAAALDIDRRLDGIDLCKKGSLWLARDDHTAPEIGGSPRIGLSRETDRRLRFYVRGNPFVSGPRKLNR